MLFVLSFFFFFLPLIEKILNDLFLFTFRFVCKVQNLRDFIKESFPFAFLGLLLLRILWNDASILLRIRSYLLLALFLLVKVLKVQVDVRLQVFLLEFGHPQRKQLIQGIG